MAILEEAKAYEPEVVGTDKFNRMMYKIPRSFWRSLIEEVERLSSIIKKRDDKYTRWANGLRNKVDEQEKQIEDLTKELEAQRPGWCPICHERIYNKVNEKIIKLESENAELEEANIIGGSGIKARDQVIDGLREKLTASEKRVGELDEENKRLQLELNIHNKTGNYL